MGMVGQSASGDGLAGGYGPETQHRAAKAIKKALPHSRARVLRFIAAQGSHGATDWEIEQGIRMRAGSVHARRNELIKNTVPKLVEDSGTTRKGYGRHQVIVWVATAEGHAAVAEMGANFE